MKKLLLFCLCFVSLLLNGLAQRPSAIHVITDTTENFRRPLPINMVLVNIQDNYIYRLTAPANTSQSFQDASKIKLGSVIEMQHIVDAINDTIDSYYTKTETETLVDDSLNNYAHIDKTNTFSRAQNMLSDLVISGNLSVLGEVDSVNVEQVSTSDNVIILNEGELSSDVTAGFSGLVVDRGTAPYYYIGYVSGKGLVLAEIDSVCTDSIYAKSKLLAVRENSTDMSNLGIPYWNSQDYIFHTENWLKLDTTNHKILQDNKSWNSDISDSLNAWNPVNYIDVHSDDTLHTRVSDEQGVWLLLDSAKVYTDSSQYIESQTINSYGNSNKYDRIFNTVTTSTASNQQLRYIHNDSLSYYCMIEIRADVKTTSTNEYHFRRYAIDFEANEISTMQNDNTGTTLGYFSLEITATDGIEIQFSPNQSEHTFIKVHYTIYRL